MKAILNKVAICPYCSKELYVTQGNNYLCQGCRKYYNGVTLKEM